MFIGVTIIDQTAFCADDGLLLQSVHLHSVAQASLRMWVIDSWLNHTADLSDSVSVNH